jgi:DNA-binding NarL/FixJ family response regulator
MLRAVPQIGCIVQADDAPAVLRATEHSPALMLLDADLPGDEAWTVLRQIKARWPQTRCIVLVNNGQQSQIANVHGADAVLAKGFTVTTLTAAVAKLCP